MTVVSFERFKLLAEQNGWSLEYAQGLVEGEAHRRMGKMPARHAIVGIDQYALGFRAGYFERKNPEPAQNGRAVAAAERLSGHARSL